MSGNNYLRYYNLRRPFLWSLVIISKAMVDDVPSIPLRLTLGQQIGNGYLLLNLYAIANDVTQAAANSGNSLSLMIIMSETGRIRTERYITIWQHAAAAGRFMSKAVQNMRPVACYPLQDVGISHVSGRLVSSDASIFSCGKDCMHERSNITDFVSVEPLAKAKTP
ncbi:hypothetical protein LIPSTDRAFT_204683 [Lipomyces starkeyi NRRL Y-11557]|uniref:Uncharacterized protein n=1 Tax=Lipomyces starkeyi NRRL Y-11557 TaxID=675824 RepID=A0A1E3PVW4_LIPST|nr:hypothetical protein LIPSTDRAFT_204683 [Lipomyces starkeyi NRRL Y-11557]